MALESDPQFFLLHHQSWLDAERFQDKILGSVIKNFADPAGSDFIPENPLQYYTEDGFIESTYNDFVINKDHSSGHEVSANITSLGGAKLIGALSDKIELKGKRVHMKRLQRYPKFWESLKEDEEVRTRLPRWVGIRTLRDPVCLVVGIMVCEDIETTSKNGESRQMGLHGEIPTVDVVLPGSSAALGQTLKIQAKVAAEQDDGVKFSGKFETRKIFALQLKNVTTPWLRHRKVKWNLDNRGPQVPKVRLLENEEQQEIGTGPVSMIDFVLDSVEDEDLDDFIS